MSEAKEDPRERLRRMTLTSELEWLKSMGERLDLLAEHIRQMEKEQARLLARFMERVDG